VRIGKAPCKPYFRTISYAHIELTELARKCASRNHKEWLMADYLRLEDETLTGCDGRAGAARPARR
jgi:hypothetical protein